MVQLTIAIKLFAMENFYFFINLPGLLPQLPQDEQELQEPVAVGTGEDFPDQRIRRCLILVGNQRFAT